MTASSPRVFSAVQQVRLNEAWWIFLACKMEGHAACYFVYDVAVRTTLSSQQWFGDVRTAFERLLFLTSLKETMMYSVLSLPRIHRRSAREKIGSVEIVAQDVATPGLSGFDAAGGFLSAAKALGLFAQSAVPVPLRGAGV